MKNTSLDLPATTRVRIIDDFTSKLVSSGYCREQTKKIVLAGLKGFEKAVRLHKEGKRTLHRSAHEGAAGRNRKKLLERSNWFKGKKGSEEEDDEKPDPRPLPPTMNRQGTRKIEGSNIAACTVLFVDQTPGGKLAAQLRQKENELAQITGWKSKIVEKGGTSLQQLLVKSNPWEGGMCGRSGCVPCQAGVEKSKCFKRNILYESSCNICRREGLEEVYVGESSRSGYERGGEHVRDCLTKKDDSHMWKHMEGAHAGEKTPDFSFKVIKTFQSALMRQVSEAVRVERRGKVLNSKGIYNRCSLPRLTVQQNDKVVEPDVVEDVDRCYSFPYARETGMKRRGEENVSREDQPVQKRKKWCGQYGEGKVWGEEGLEKNVATFLYSAGGKKNVGGRKRQTKLKVLKESELVARSMVKEVLEGANHLISLVVGKDEENWLVEELDKCEDQMRKELELESSGSEVGKLEVETAGRGTKRKGIVKLRPPAPAKKPKLEKKKISKIATNENPIKNLWEKLKKKKRTSEVSDSQAMGVEFDNCNNYSQSNVPGCAVGVECGKNLDNVLSEEAKPIMDLGLIVLNDSKGENSSLRSESSRQLDRESEREGDM